MEVVVLCPSRGRPDNAVELQRTFNDTRHGSSSELIFVLDADDRTEAYAGLQTIVVEPSGRRGMTDPLNTAVRHVWDTEVVGFVGDDHRFRTSGWDMIFRDQLRSAGPGLVYGNDLNRVDGDIPTQIFGSGIIWKTLGWMALPACRHLFLDNAWRVIGESLDRLFYFPDVVIEHAHPAYGKAEWDDQYRELNASSTYNEDGEAFNQWLNSEAAEEIGKLRGLL